MAIVEPTTEIRERVALNVDVCIECRSCAAACFHGHHDEPTVHFARIGAAMLPALCRQCPDAPCVMACPADAMRREPTGTVHRTIFRCRGCGSCARACPFGVLAADTFDGEVAKCDLCSDQLQHGDSPRCVTSCPTGALQFIDESAAAEQGLTVLGSRTLGQHPIRRR